MAARAEQAVGGGRAKSVDTVAAPLLILRGLWWPLEGPLSSQLLHHGPVGEQHAVQELTLHSHGHQGWPKQVGGWHCPYLPQRTVDYEELA